jgi:hypothetical protein
VARASLILKPEILWKPPIYIYIRESDECDHLHLQDEVLLPWYLHTTPSFSANGWYTFQNLSAPIPLVVNSPATIAGSYTNTATLSFAPVNMPVTGNVVYVGRGCPGDNLPGQPERPNCPDRPRDLRGQPEGRCGAAKAGAIGTLIGLVAPGDAVSFS